MSRGCERGRREGCRLAWMLILAVLGVFLLVLLRLQLVHQERYADDCAELAERHCMLWARRGTIYDRDGYPLNACVVRHRFVLHPELVCDPRLPIAANLDRLEARIAQFSAFVSRELFYHGRPSRRALVRHLKRRTPLPIPLVDDIDETLQRKWSVDGQELFPEVAIERYFVRHYYFPHIASLLRGRVESFRRGSTPQRPFNFNRNLDMAGNDALERACDSVLAGVPGYERILVDIRGYHRGDVKGEAPRPGRDIYMTVSLSLQCQGEFLMQGYRGALVLIHIPTGEVLVAVSSPEPDLDSSLEERRDFEAVFGEEGFIFKPLGMVSAMGSAGKLLTGAEGLRSGALEPGEPFPCDGVFPLTRRRTIPCPRGHGTVLLPEALACSCNDFFCSLGLRIGTYRLAEAALEFGFGRCPGTILGKQTGRPTWNSMESRGFVPTKERMRATLERSAYPGEAALVAIGQGPFSATCMQAATYVACFADGVYRPPKLVRDRAGDDRESRRLSFPPEILATIRQGMVEAVEQPYGTAKRAAVDGIRVAAKTGTAQYDHPSKGRMKNCWTVALAPAEAPEYAVACIVQDGVSGGRTAAPIVGQLLQRVFLRTSHEPSLSAVDTEGAAVTVAAVGP